MSRFAAVAPQGSHECVMWPQNKGTRILMTCSGPHPGVHLHVYRTEQPGYIVPGYMHTCCSEIHAPFDMTATWIAC